MVYISADSLPQNSLKQKCVRDGGGGGGVRETDRQTDRQIDRQRDKIILYYTRIKI